MRTRPTILFVFRKPKTHTGIEKPTTLQGIISCCITVRGKRAYITTGIATTYGEWEAKSQRLNGRTTAVKQANEAFTKMRDRLTDLAADLDRQNKAVTAKRLQQLYLTDGATVNLLELFNLFLTEQKGLVGIEIGNSTTYAHRARFSNLKNFLAAHKLEDLRPEEFSHSMADRMLYWLIGHKKFQRNTALKNLQNVSQVLRWGVRRELLDKNPMELYRYRLQSPKDIIYLTPEQVATLSTCPLPSATLENVRNAFVFQCWTGLAFADLLALDMSKSVEVLSDGRRLLRVRRQKSTITHGYECVIPLLPEAERILARYEDEVPVYTNQVYNRYLKELGALVGLPDEKMTSHVGRKTAGVMMLNAGIRMEVVSKFLGHASVQMTQKVYAKILDKTVLTEFDRVFAPTPPAPKAPDQGARVVPMWNSNAA